MGLDWKERSTDLVSVGRSWDESLGVIRCFICKFPWGSILRMVVDFSHALCLSFRQVSNLFHAHVIVYIYIYSTLSLLFFWIPYEFWALLVIAKLLIPLSPVFVIKDILKHKMFDSRSIFRNQRKFIVMSSAGNGCCCTS